MGHCGRNPAGKLLNEGKAGNNSGMFFSSLGAHSHVSSGAHLSNVNTKGRGSKLGFGS
jgi:hypothetical protein